MTGLLFVVPVKQARSPPYTLDNDVFTQCQLGPIVTQGEESDEHR